jgi:hypothetical protein
MRQIRLLLQLLAVPLVAACVLFILVLIASNWVEPPFQDVWLLAGWLAITWVLSWPLGRLWQWVSVAIPLVVYSWFSLAISPLWALVIAVLLWLVYRNGAGGQVPFYRASGDVISALRLWLDERATAQTPLSFADMGCGDGRVLLGLADHPNLKSLHGYETAWLPYLMAQLRASRLQPSSKPKLQIDRQSFWQVPWSEYDLIYVYLSPAVMNQVAEKASLELANQAWLVSYEFPIEESVCAAHPLILTDVWELGEKAPTRLYWYQKSPL